MTRKGTVKYLGALAADERLMLTKRDYLDDPLKFGGVPPFRGADSSLNLIAESALYRLILRAHRSRPQAAAFQDWVTRTVIPSISPGFALRERYARRKALRSRPAPPSLIVTCEKPANDADDLAPDPLPDRLVRAGGARHGLGLHRRCRQCELPITSQPRRRHGRQAPEGRSGFGRGHQRRLVQDRRAVVLGELGVPVGGDRLGVGAVFALQGRHGLQEHEGRPVPRVDPSPVLRPLCLLRAPEKDQPTQQGPAVLQQRLQRRRRELSVQRGQRVRGPARRALLHHQRGEQEVWGVMLLQVLKDYSPIVSPFLSPFIAAATAVFLYRRKEQERVHCSIEWQYVDTLYGRDQEPFLVVHNRSDRSVALKDIRYLSGLLLRKRSESTALGYEDPEDIHFPYLVEPGQLRLIRLDDLQAVGLADKSGMIRQLLSRFGCGRLSVQVITTADKRITVAADEAIPWKKRPPWLQ